MLVRTWQRRNPYALLVGLEIGAATMKVNMQFPQKCKNKNYLMIQQFHSGIHPKEIKSLSRRDICTPIFTAALLTITKTWKQCKCPSADE